MAAKMVFDYWSSTEDTDSWYSTFLARADPMSDRQWSWCPASFTNKYTLDKVCSECGMPIKTVQKNLSRPHLTKKTAPGIYLIDVGEYKKAPGARRLKIGMSQNAVAGRLEQHLQNPSHERCVVHYCFPIERSDPRLTWQVPEFLETLLQAHLTVSGAEYFGYEYFVWSDELLERCVQSGELESRLKLGLLR